VPRIRLVCLINQFGMGGSERQLYLFLRHADRALCERHVVVLNSSPNQVYDALAEEAGARVWTVPGTCRSIAARMRFLASTLYGLSPNVVHSWSFHDNVYAALVGRLVGSRVCLGSLRDSFYSTEVLGLPRVYRRLALYGVSRIVVNSPDIMQELVAEGYPANHVVVVPNGVEVEMASDRDVPLALSSLGIQAEQRLVAIVGNLRAKKNHDMFIRAMARVLSRFPDVRGLIIGQPVATEPDLPAQLAAEIQSLGLEGKVVLAGFRPDVPALMRRFEVVCLTSRYEGMPNAILEAMAAGRPVVATRVSGVPELVRDGVNGLLIEQDDVVGFAAAVVRLLSDPDLTRRMGEAGREIARREFGCEQAAQRLTDLYLKLLGHRHELYNQEARARDRPIR